MLWGSVFCLLLFCCLSLSIFFSGRKLFLSLCHSRCCFCGIGCNNKGEWYWKHSALNGELRKVPQLSSSVTILSSRRGEEDTRQRSHEMRIYLYAQRDSLVHKKAKICQRCCSTEDTEETLLWVRYVTLKHRITAVTSITPVSLKHDNAMSIVSPTFRSISQADKVELATKIHFTNSRRPTISRTNSPKTNFLEFL